MQNTPPLTSGFRVEDQGIREQNSKKLTLVGQLLGHGGSAIFSHSIALKHGAPEYHLKKDSDPGTCHQCILGLTMASEEVCTRTHSSKKRKHAGSEIMQAFSCPEALDNGSARIRCTHDIVHQARSCIPFLAPRRLRRSVHTFNENSDQHRVDAQASKPFLALRRLRLQRSVHTYTAI